MSEWYYTKGGAQQGPVSIEQLRGMVASGSLPAGDTLVWNSSMTDWRPVSEVPELSGAGVTSSPPPISSQPFAYPVSTGEFVEIEPGSEPLIPTMVLKRGFDLTVRNIGPCLIGAVVFIALSIGFQFSVSFIQAAFFGLADSKNDVGTGFAPLGLMIISNLLFGLFQTFLMLGVTRMAFDAVAGRPVRIESMFGGGRYLAVAFGAYLLYTLMVIIGSILLVIPGIFLAIAFGMYLTAIVDKNLGVIDSLSYSWKLTENNRLMLFCLMLLNMLVGFAGCIALGVGLLFAYPMMALVNVIAFRWLQYGGRVVMDDPVTQVPLLSALPEDQPPQ